MAYVLINIIQVQHWYRCWTHLQLDMVWRVDRWIDESREIINISCGRISETSEMTFWATASIFIRHTGFRIHENLKFHFIPRKPVLVSWLLFLCLLRGPNYVPCWLSILEMSRPIYVCTVCSEHFTRKYSRQRQLWIQCYTWVVCFKRLSPVCTQK
jgi:hypothetical protein